MKTSVSVIVVLATVAMVWMTLGSATIFCYKCNSATPGEVCNTVSDNVTAKEECTYGCKITNFVFIKNMTTRGCSDTIVNTSTCDSTVTLGSYNNGQTCFCNTDKCNNMAFSTGSVLRYQSVLCFFGLFVTLFHFLV